MTAHTLGATKILIQKLQYYNIVVLKIIIIITSVTMLSSEDEASDVLQLQISNWESGSISSFETHSHDPVMKEIGEKTYVVLALFH